MFGSINEIIHGKLLGGLTSSLSQKENIGFDDQLILLNLAKLLILVLAEL